MPETQTKKPTTKKRTGVGERPSAARPKTQIRPALKEFDIRTAHKEWKERNGLDIDDPW